MCTFRFCVLSLCEFSVNLFVLLCNYTDHNHAWFPRAVIFGGFLVNLNELLNNHNRCNYVFFPVMFWLNVNIKNTFGFCSIITSITTIWFHYVSHLVRFQQLFFVWFVLALDSKMLWFLDLYSKSSQPNNSPSCFISTCVLRLHFWLALYTQNSQWYHKLFWVLRIWESNMAGWFTS